MKSFLQTAGYLTYGPMCLNKQEKQISTQYIFLVLKIAKALIIIRYIILNIGLFITLGFLNNSFYYQLHYSIE